MVGGHSNQKVKKNILQVKELNLLRSDDLYKIIIIIILQSSGQRPVPVQKFNF
jgi:hypothetical protein